ncbi:MAG: hypothetical protein AAGC55_10495 [Myxococcota bacterium]
MPANQPANRPAARIFWATLASVTLAGAGCGASATPEVAVVEVSPETIDPADTLSDDLRIVVEYSDGDGNLGEGIAEIHDCRSADVVTELPIPPIASPEAVADGVAIEGTLTLIVPNIGALAPDPDLPAVCAERGVSALNEDRAVFCVILVDSAGERSAGDCTDPVTVATSG